MSASVARSLRSRVRAGSTIAAMAIASAVRRRARGIQCPRVVLVFTGAITGAVTDAAFAGCPQAHRLPRAAELGLVLRPASATAQAILAATRCRVLP